MVWAKSARLGRSAWIAGIGVALCGSQVSEAATRCFAAPQAGAKASWSGGTLSAPAVIDPCESLRVDAGDVRVIYPGAAGLPEIETVSAGGKPRLAGAGASTGSFAEVADVVAAPLRDLSGAGPSTKKFDGAKYTPSSFGAPIGEVFAPASGLAFVVKTPAAPPDKPSLRILDASVTVVDEASGRSIYLGSAAAGGRITIPRAPLKPGSKYRIRLLVRVADGNALQVAGEFELISADRERELLAQMARLLPKVPDPQSAAFARAVLFEEEGLTFNSRQSAEEIKP